MLRSRSALTCPGGKLNTTLLTSRSQAETTVNRDTARRGEGRGGDGGGKLGNGDVGERGGTGKNTAEIPT